MTQETHRKLKVNGVRLYYRFMRFLCRGSMMLHLKARFFGMGHVPRQGGVLLVCNHQSLLDPVLATMALPRECSYMARDTLFEHPLFGRLIRSLNAFPVRRGAADVGAIKESLRRLKQGMSLLVFPEGTRTPDGRIRQMMPGLGAIARKAKVPIVPTLIDGAFQAWPRESRLPRPGNAIIEYGTAIMPNEYARLGADELMELIRGRLIAMQHRWHSRLPERRLEWFQAEDSPRRR